MSFWGRLGSLLGRRFSPRGSWIPRARAQAKALAEALEFYGAVFGLAVGNACLYLEEFESLFPSQGEAATGKKRRLPPVDYPAIRAKFTDEEGKVAWFQYHGFIHFLMLHPKVTDYGEMVRKIFPRHGNVETEEQEGGMSVVDDVPAMEARFEAWMKEYGSMYKDEEMYGTHRGGRLIDDSEWEDRRLSKIRTVAADGLDAARKKAE